MTVLLLASIVAACSTTATPPPDSAELDARSPAKAAEKNSDPETAEPARTESTPPVERTFRYDPGDRRDPFVSPLEAIEEARGPRPAGILGMSVDDLDLTGIVAIPGGSDVAYLTGSDGNGYMLRLTDPVYNATVQIIDAGAGTITFREQVDDPRSNKPYRDRVLRLGSGAE